MLGCTIYTDKTSKLGERKVTVARTVAEYTLTHTNIYNVAQSKL